MHCFSFPECKEQLSSAPSFFLIHSLSLEFPFIHSVSPPSFSPTISPTTAATLPSHSSSFYASEYEIVCSYLPHISLTLSACLCMSNRPNCVSNTTLSLQFKWEFSEDSLHSWYEINCYWMFIHVLWIKKKEYTSWPVSRFLSTMAVSQIPCCCWCSCCYYRQYVSPVHNNWKTSSSKK